MFMCKFDCFGLCDKKLETFYGKVYRYNL